MVAALTLPRLVSGSAAVSALADELSQLRVDRPLLIILSPIGPNPVRFALRYLHPNALPYKSCGPNFLELQWLTLARHERGQDDREGRFARCDGKSRQLNARDDNRALSWPG